jgi:hypothetical protein
LDAINALRIQDFSKSAQSTLNWPGRKTPFSMRLLLPFAASLLCMPAIAQHDAHEHQPETIYDRLSTSGNVGQVKVEDDNDPYKPNAFVGSFRMEMHRYSEGVEDRSGPADMHYWSSPDMTLISMAREGAKGGPGTDIKILTDLKNKWNYFLMTDPKGNKTAMKSPKKKFIYPETESNKGHNANFTVTNVTKVIDGHTCTKVISKSDEGTWTGWVAKDIPLSYSDIASNMSRRAVENGRQDWEGLQGFPLEFEMTDENGKRTMQVFVKDLHVGAVDPGLFSISGYKVMEVPGMQRTPEK